VGDASVSVATDRCIYQSEVFVASTPAPTVARKVGAMQGKDGEREREKGWGGHAVLVLVGIRLSLDRANPVYYDTIKVRLSPPGGVFKFIHICARIHTLYTLPQSVGIAGGRPSLSYYFVGSQVDDLFYLMRVQLPRSRFLLPSRWRLRLNLVGNGRRRRS